METLKKSQRPLTLILNIPPHYREPIFRRIEDQWDCKWIFGENKTNIPSCATGFMREVSFLPIERGRFNTWWLKGLYHTIGNTSDRDVIMTGEIKFLSSWSIMLRNLLKPRKHKARIYLWSHGWNGSEKGLRRLVYKLYFGMADGLLLYGERSREIALKEGLDEAKISVIHNSLNHDRFLALRDECSKKDRRDIYTQIFPKPNLPVLVYIGRLSIIKKIPMLVEAVAQLKSTGSEVNALIIGEGPDRNEIELMVKSLGLEDNIRFTGAKYDISETAPLIYHADVCVSPGHIGLTAIHALELGTPSVTHSDFTMQAPEVEAIKSGVSGQFFKKDDIKDLEKAISRQLNRNNKIGREAVRKTCYEIVETWTPEWQLQKISKAVR